MMAPPSFSRPSREEHPLRPEALPVGALVFEDAASPEGIRIFEGRLFGARVSADQMLRTTGERGSGEGVFNTSLTGYQEILTDPSYRRQIICMTSAHIGNTGINRRDAESGRIWCAGLVVRELSAEASSWRAEGSLHAWLEREGVPALCEIDTRGVTRFLRTRGAARALLLSAEDLSRAVELFARLPRIEDLDLIDEVTVREATPWKSSRAGEPANPRFRVAALDFGAKANLLDELVSRGCSIDVLPAKTGAAEILARKPDGVFLSNGPGDPQKAAYAVATIRELVGKVPVFGVCMGHQLLSLAAGAKTYKLKFGHRGGNQPVIDHGTGQVEISSHNHGYAVDETSLPASVEVTHRNLNDRCIEGIRLKPAAAEGPEAFSVQYHPEACPGPHDSVILFERFVREMERFQHRNRG